MNYKVKEIEEKLKNDLIDYYDSLKFDIDIKAQAHELLNQESLKQDQTNKLFEENVYLVEQIDRVLNSNLNDISHFFENWNYHSLEINFFENFHEEIKKKALKSYIISIKYKNHDLFGLYLEFEWYIDQNQLNFIK
jgi:hypothetical protein